MKRILITGATGNIGKEIIRFLFESGTEMKIVAGVRDILKARMVFEKYPGLEYVQFDFEDIASFETSLDSIDSLFLLRPPHISDVPKYFYPLIKKISEKGIKEIIFLSVQGAEKSKVIPHNKIEKLIRESGLDFIFIRPSYFMQNLTTTLIEDIRERRKIILPAGNARFNWIDIVNIGETTAILLKRFEEFRGMEIEITGSENLSFSEVTKIINETNNTQITFESPNPLSFYLAKRREGHPSGLILVMILLHFLPRFQKEPEISDFYSRLTGKKPTIIEDFAKRERQLFVE